jgi:hypothetical protein
VESAIVVMVTSTTLSVFIRRLDATNLSVKRRAEAQSDVQVVLLAGRSAAATYSTHTSVMFTSAQVPLISITSSAYSDEGICPGGAGGAKWGVAGKGGDPVACALPQSQLDNCRMRSR